MCFSNENAHDSSSSGRLRSQLQSVIKHQDNEFFGEMTNANIAHDCGFFVGNHPKNIFENIDYLRDLLSRFTEKS